MPTGERPAPEAQDGTARLAAALGWTACLLALLRFLRLGDWGLWIDEAHTLHDALRIFEGRPSTYPLGYLAVRGAIALSGGALDEATLRLAPALFGALSIPLLSWSLRPALGRLGANGAAFLMGASSWHLYWSQNARGYSLALLLSVLGVGLWLRGLIGGRAALLALGLFVTALSAFAHPSGALLLPGLVLAPLALVGLRRDDLPRPPVALLVGVALLGALALSGWGLRVWSVHETVKSGSSTSHLIQTCGWYMGPLTLIAAVLGTLQSLRAGRSAPLALALVGVPAGALALSASLWTVVSAQYVFVLLPLIVGMAAWPMTHFARTPLRAAWIALLAAPALFDNALYFSVRHGDRPRWREAYAWIAQARGEDDLVLGMHAPVGEYYLVPGKSDLRNHEGLMRLNEATASEVDLWLRRGRRVWLVVNPEDLMAWSAPARAAFNGLLAGEARLQAEFDVPLTPRDLRVRVYLLEG
jgi:mannosyltransferase